VFFFAAGAGASRGIAADVSRRALVDLKAGVIDDEEPGGAEEDIADVVGSAQDGQTLGRRGQVAYVQRHLPVAEARGGLLGGWRFLVILPDEFAAARGDRLRPSTAAQAPQRHIHFVHALVADVAVAGIPEPVPVVR